MRFSQAKLPWQTGMCGGGQRRCTGTTIVAGDQHHIGKCFRHTGGDGAYAHFSYQLHADTGSAVTVLQIMNQLGQIFDGIDVVMRRR